MADKKKHPGSGKKKVEPAQQDQQQIQKRDLWFHPGADRDFKDPKKIPADIQEAFTHGLRVARKGKYPESAKPWKGEGSGVYELREDDEGGTYRCVYVVRFEEAVYVLHAWHKKSSKGIKTADDDVEKVKQRLKWAQADYTKRYPKTNKKGGS